LGVAVREKVTVHACVIEGEGEGGMDAIVARSSVIWVWAAAGQVSISSPRARIS